MSWIDLSNHTTTQAIVLHYLEKSYPFTTWLKDAHDFGDLDGAEYTRLREALRRYRQFLRGYLSPFCRTPPEIITHIVKYATPEVEIDDFSHRSSPAPDIYCPQVTVVARLSKRFHAIVYSQPQLFSTILLRRHITCGDHQPILSVRISRLLHLSAARPLEVTIELVDRGDISPSAPSTLPLSPCSSIDMLRSKPWQTFTFLGPSYVGATAMHLFPAVDLQSWTACMTALHLCPVTSLETLLGALKSAAIPLQTLFLAAADAWETPDLNHTARLPPTLQHLHIRGSSRTVLCILQAALDVPSVSVTLVSGLDSGSATWQNTPGIKLAKPTLLLQKPIKLPRLSSFRIVDRDYWGHVGPDFLRSVILPNLDTLILSWEHSTTWFNTLYVDALNQLLAQTPTLQHVYMINVPQERSLVYSPFPECNIHWYWHRVSATEWMDVRHTVYQDSDSEFSDADSLSVASAEIECICSDEADYCPCYEPRYERYSSY
ncbi:hypothetical protein VNI00_004352 [Paramarasmius palmivorus]|uniref:F-box domain-containing protein n=1 Tax=Paramarasmius palmivorus TaxID=297713 RepID=A0AAW0DKC9_9AGAR